MTSAHMSLKYVNQTKIKGGCQSVRKVLPHDFKSDLPLRGGLTHHSLLFLGCLVAPLSLSSQLNSVLLYYRRRHTVLKSDGSGIGATLVILHSASKKSHEFGETTTFTGSSSE